ncbi:MAG TPA: tRNA (adenosine(37)-N6)-threonylcarbamoyltransferase complex ATPase subunit type 1 TsaE [Longimicrobiales bacterium]|nr:tRNA (adenosine(37)-N6)-threonylcarbamoyltransferase complex ATPase subunit type 1 TsaE [Longimicrobiales bacterium]
MKLTEKELERWGRRIGESVDPPVFLGLRGPLGAGKSVLARAVARGAGVQGAIPSPTFNLVFHYEGRAGVKVRHLDLYRLRNPDELWELGWEELGDGDEIVLVEWPERAGPLLPADRWDIELRVQPGASSVREIAVSRVGEPAHLPGFPMALSQRRRRR